MTTKPSFENALAFAQDLIRIPSPSGEEGEVAARVMGEMESLGYDDARIDGMGNVIGLIRGTGQGPSVMLNCHMDVVAEGDPDQWEHPPFDGVVEGGFLHGRGAMDIKGPLAIQTHAAASLRGMTSGDIIVAHTVFEERGGWGMEELMRSGEVSPDVVIIGEATRGDVTTGHRGRAEVEVVVRGLAGHASAPERARNALDLVPQVLAGVRRLASRQPSDPVLGPSSLVATTVNVSPESRNVIPDEVVIVLDWRVLPESTDEGLLDLVRQALDGEMPTLPEGFGMEVRMAKETQTTFTGRTEDRPLFTPGFLMDETDPVILAAARAVGGRNGEGMARVRPWTFATDGGWSQGVFGIPTLGFAPGEERFAHTNRERLELEEARWAYHRHPDLILGLQEILG
ncbi:MAG: M20/M25/M40 family metallo-hydrolase [Longimicrobiales bacterium]